MFKRMCGCCGKVHKGAKTFGYEVKLTIISPSLKEAKCTEEVPLSGLRIPNICEECLTDITKTIDNRVEFLQKVQEDFGELQSPKDKIPTTFLQDEIFTVNHYIAINKFFPKVDGFFLAKNNNTLIIEKKESLYDANAFNTLEGANDFLKEYKKYQTKPPIKVIKINI